MNSNLISALTPAQNDDLTPAMVSYLKSRVWFSFDQLLPLTPAERATLQAKFLDHRLPWLGTILLGYLSAWEEEVSDFAHLFHFICSRPSGDILDAQIDGCVQDSVLEFLEAENPAWRPRFLQHLDTWLAQGATSAEISWRLKRLPDEDFLDFGEPLHSASDLEWPLRSEFEEERYERWVTQQRKIDERRSAPWQPPQPGASMTDTLAQDLTAPGDLEVDLAVDLAADLPLSPLCDAAGTPAWAGSFSAACAYFGRTIHSGWWNDSYTEENCCIRELLEVQDPFQFTTDRQAEPGLWRVAV